MSACDIIVAFASVDDDLKDFAYFLFVFLERDGLLELHEFAYAALLFLFGDGVAERMGWRVFLGGIGEASHAVEAGLEEELFQFLEFGFGFARIADNKGGADADVGDEVAELLQELQGLFAVDATIHGVEQAGVDVLEGDVDIVADVRMLSDGLNGVDGERGRVGVVEANPWGAALGGEEVEKVAESAAAVEVEAVVGGVLSDEDEFFGSIVDQLLRFEEDVFDGAGDVFATDEGDGAVGAAAVAAFGYFEVGVVIGSGERAFGSKRFLRSGLSGDRQDSGDELLPLVDTEPVVDLREFGAELIEVAFDETAGGNECTVAVVVGMATVEIFGLADLFEEGVDGFFLGIADEAAGVEDDDVAVVVGTVEEDGLSSG